MDKPQVDSHRRHPARDRHRPDEPRAHLALDRRHDDRAQRSPEAAVRARRAACTAAAAASRCAAIRRSRSMRRCASAPRRLGDPRARDHVPGRRAEELHRGRGHEAAARRRATRASTQREGDAPRSRRRTACGWAARRRRASSKRSKPRCESAAGRVNVHPPTTPDGATPTPGASPRDLHCADCDIHYSRPDAGALLVQLAHRRVRHVPRLRARDRHRLRPHRPRRNEDASRGRGQALRRRRATTSARTTSSKLAREALDPARHAVARPAPPRRRAG